MKLILVTPLLSSLVSLSISAHGLPQGTPNLQGINKYLAIAKTKCNSDEKEVLKNHFKSIVIISNSSRLVDDSESKPEFESDYVEYLVSYMYCDKPSKGVFNSFSDSSLHKKYPITMQNMLKLGVSLVCEKMPIDATRNTQAPSYACK
jgi:hypothetical protein